MATINGSTLSTIGTAWKGRATAPVPELQLLTKQTAINFQTNGNGSTKVFNIPHSLDKWPRAYVLKYGHADSNAAHTVTATSTNLVVTFTTAPPAGTNNVKYTG